MEKISIRLEGSVTPDDLPPLNARIRVPESVLMRKVGDEMVMLNLADEKYYGLNEVGAFLMHHTEAGATLAEVTDRLLEEFEVGREQLEMDVRRVAAELLAVGLVEAAP